MSGTIRRWMVRAGVFAGGFGPGLAHAENFTQAQEVLAEDAPPPSQEPSGSEPPAQPVANDAPSNVSFVRIIPYRADEYARLTREIYSLELEKQKFPLGGPIALLATGGGVAIAGAYLVLFGLASPRYSYYAPYGSSDTRNTLIGTGVVAGLAGLGMGIGGMSWLISRARDRRAYSDQIEALEVERDLIEHGDPRNLDEHSRSAPQRSAPRLEVTGIGFDPEQRAVFLSGTF